MYTGEEGSYGEIPKDERRKTKDEEDTMIENYIYSFGRFFLPDEYIYTYLESKDY